MSTESTSENTEEAADRPPAPPAADRPVVDGTTATSDELRAELERMLEEDRARAAAQPRTTQPETVAELASRTGVGGSRSAPAPVASGGRAGAVVERARVVVPERAAEVTETVRQTARERPGALAAVATGLVLLLLGRRLLNRK